MSKLIARGIAPKSILRKPKDILRETVLRNLTKAGLRRIRTNRSRRKKYIRGIVYGIINVQTTFNNTIVTVTDGQGQVAWWASGGASGSKGRKRGTPFAAQNATKDAIYPVIGHQGMRRAEVRIRGSGPGRDAALRVIKNSRIRLRSVYNVTPVPHNGCRPPKKRQV